MQLVPGPPKPDVLRLLLFLLKSPLSGGKTEREFYRNGRRVRFSNRRAHEMSTYCCYTKSPPLQRAVRSDTFIVARH